MKPISSSSSATIQALLHLSYESEHKHKNIPATIKLLEALLQSGIPLLPLQEIEARLRLSGLLLIHTHNLTHAKSHLERAHFLLSQIPSSTHLKLKAHSLLAHCYYLIGSIPQQKLVLLKGLALLDDEMGLDDEEETVMWGVGMRAQLGAGMAVEGDYDGAARELEKAVEMVTGWEGGRWTELRMLFAAMVLHVKMLWWEDEDEVREAARRCEEIWDGLDDEKKQQCVGLFFYHELLQTFYLLRICDYKTASQHVDRLDAAMKADLQKVQIIKELTQELDSVNQSLSKTNLQRKQISALSQKKEELEEQFKEATGFDPSDYHICTEDKLFLAPPPLDGEWLPKSAVYALVDLMTVMLGRPKGVFKECGKRIQSGLNLIHDELIKLGITNGTTEVDLQHSAIWMAGLYLMLLMQFLENKVAVELTRSEFVEAQQALVQMRDWFIRFPTILQGCECTIEMLRGQYAHSVGCFHEAAFHFLEATKLTESKSMQSMCQVYAAVSYICIGDADSSAQALELVGPVYKIVDSFIGVREKTCIVFAYGLLLMRQHKLQEARIRLASGLKIAHQQLGNIQLVSQYLTILGTLALQLHDIGQAREILKSSLTLAKTLYDIPTQIWVVSVLSALYQEVGERENEMENSEYERKKEEDLQKRLSGAHSHVHHFELIEKARIEVKQLHGLDIKRAIAGPSNKVDLDIPESIGLPTLIPSIAFSSRLRDGDSVKRGKRKV